MDFTFILNFLTTLAPWVNTLFVILGSLVVIGSGIDYLSKDQGAFYQKMINIPILGSFITALIKFSPFGFTKPQ